VAVHAAPGVRELTGEELLEDQRCGRNGKSRQGRYPVSYQSPRH
jgi:hypothetical protein